MIAPRGDVLSEGEGVWGTHDGCRKTPSPRKTIVRMFYFSRHMSTYTRDIHIYIPGTGYVGGLDIDPVARAGNATFYSDLHLFF